METAASSNGRDGRQKAGEEVRAGGDKAASGHLDVLGLTSEQAVAAAREVGVPVNSSLGGYKAVFRNGARAAGPWKVELPEVVGVLREMSDEGEVVKFVCRVPRVLAGGGVETVETESVLIPMMGTVRGRTYTLCLSSQIGCAMGCGFCETAQMGLIRSLRAREIVAQWYVATHELGIRPKNIVFMGMGEPLDNFDEVMQAVSVLKDHNGAGVPISQVTISTVGKIDGMKRMAEWIQQPTWHRLNLAVSLNAPSDAVRDALMPVNRRWKLAELQRTLLEWPVFGGNKFCIEYVLIPGVNDTRQAAREVAEFVRPLRTKVKGNDKDTRARAVVNIIPYNPRRNSPWPAPSEECVNEFIGWLIDERVFVKRRRTKGREMMGACGQLGNEAIRKRKYVGEGDGVTLSVSAPRAG